MKITTLTGKNSDLGCATCGHSTSFSQLITGYLPEILLDSAVLSLIFGVILTLFFKYKKKASWKVGIKKSLPGTIIMFILLTLIQLAIPLIIVGMD